MPGQQTRGRRSNYDDNSTASTGDRRRQAREQRSIDKDLEQAYDDGYSGGKPRPENEVLAGYYDDGRKAARDDAKRSPKAAPKKPATKPATNGRRRAAAKPARRRPPSTRRALRQLRNPVRRQVTSGGQALFLTLAVIALYLFLENASAVSGFLGFATRAIQWLQDPTRSVAYAPGYNPGATPGDVISKAASTGKEVVGAAGAIAGGMVGAAESLVPVIGN